jgi:hypothetical protein
MICSVLITFTTLDELEKAAGVAVAGLFLVEQGEFAVVKGFEKILPGNSSSFSSRSLKSNRRTPEPSRPSVPFTRVGFPPRDSAHFLMTWWSVVVSNRPGNARFPCDAGCATIGTYLRSHWSCSAAAGEEG